MPEPEDESEDEDGSPQLAGPGPQEGSEQQEELQGLVREVAGAAFGFDDLRRGQEEAAAAVLAGGDVLAVMPTGGGKSAIYQLAGALIDGTTVVVSPLIALQRDQVEAIGGRLGGAAQVNSSMSARHRKEAFADLRAGGLEFVFVAPEQLANEETLEQVAAARPTLFVVDEAHCISTWGHDFRPDYLRLGPLVERLGHPRVLALTATAAPPVRREIVEQLRMRDPVVVVAGFDRPNIWLGVETARDEAAARAALVERAGSLAGTGIVYVATRREAEELAAELATAGRPASAYHAGLTAGERDGVHERFLRPEAFLVVATVAFGMGIDAPHVRFVLHAGPPESLDAYYQELGRAGRDGEDACAVLFHAREGGAGRRFSTGAGEVPRELVERAAAAVSSGTGAVGVDELAERLGVPRARARRAVDLLAAAGAVSVSRGRTVSWRRGASPAEAAAAAAERHEAYRAVERSRARMMQRYVETAACRWEALLGYLGQPTGERCGHCDNCDGGLATGGAEGEVPFPLDSRVRHEAWGDGQVVGYDGDTMTVLFDEGGYRTLSIALVAQGELLRPVGTPAPG